MNNHPKRLLELDVLRGLAALSVVLFHYTTQYNIEYGHSKEMLIDLPYGKYGVELFFMISGFVIFMSLEKVKNGLDFLIGRFSRLYPAYWVSVILSFTIVSITGLPGHNVSWHDFLINLTMLQVFFGTPNVDNSYWTLGVELSFYIIMFILYKAKMLKHIENIAISWLLLLAVTIMLEKLGILSVESRITTFFLLGKPHLSVYANIFIAGIMSYKIHKEGFSAKRYGIIIGCILVYKLQHLWWETLIVTALLFIFNMMMKGRIPSINNKLLVFLGSISYTLYLVHQNIGYVVIRLFYKIEKNPHTIILIAIGLSILLAMTITFLVEKPMMYMIREQYKKTALRQTVQTQK